MMNLPPDLQSALLGRRVVFLRGRLDEALANSVIGQLLVVSQMGPGIRIELYIDSAGGSPGAALSVYDMLQSLGAPVATTCLGTAGGAAVLVLAGGAAGQRAALPHARIHLTHARVDMPPGVADAVADQAAQAAAVRTHWVAALARHSAHSAAQLERDLADGKWLSTAEARDYGLVDGIYPGQPPLG
jgi:ATP-dependent Clp protease protease subunit